MFLFKTFVKPHEHVADENGQVIVLPTCTSEGYRYEVCKDKKCGEIFDRQTFSVIPHKTVTSIENEKPHTLTQGESYEKVLTCSVCKTEVSRDVVWVDGNHNVEIIETIEKEVPATCTVNGSYELVKTCKGCGEEIERKKMVDYADGHSYEWTLTYSESTETFAMVGKCSADNHVVTYTQLNNSSFVCETDPNYAPCCGERYVATVMHDGVEVSAYIDFAPTQNHTVEYFEDYDSYINNKPSYQVLPDLKYDAEANKYYFDVDTPGVERDEAGAHSDWVEFGVCLGKFVCHVCKEAECNHKDCPESYVHYVYIYSAEHDSRIEIEIPI